MSAFTCLSCQVSFTSSLGQKNHMKSDWHRYNLKRKVVELPPLSAQQFQQKLLESQPVVEEQESYCRVCKKSYSSAGALKSHLVSKKHLENVKNQAEDAEIVSVVSANASDVTSESFKESIKVRLGKARTVAEVDQILAEKMENAAKLTPLDCLFCQNVSLDIQSNLKHMAGSHSFFIPDPEFLSDIEGLLQYLGDKVAIGNVCLYCNGKGRIFHTLEAVRAHMIQKGHCKIYYEDGQEDEIAEFYEFGKEEGWKDIDDEDVDIQMDDDEMVIDEDEDEEDDSNQPRIEGTDLILPNGKIIGHRQFKRFWKQNIKPKSIVPGSRSDPLMIKGLENSYRMIGYQQYSGALTVQQRLEQKIQKRENVRQARRENYHKQRVGVKHNMLQHHYREQNPF